RITYFGRLVRRSYSDRNESSLKLSSQTDAPRGCQKYPPDYWLADTFDSFRGAFFCNTATKWRPDAGIRIFPPNTISLAVSFRPYTSAVASSSGRSVEPSSEMPAKRPR